MLILAYHRVNPGAVDGLSITPEAFEAQLKYLSEKGWVNAALDEAVSPTSRSAPTSRKFAITLDDGYQDNYYYALPVLRRLGMRATVFVAVDYTRTQRPFPWVRKAIERDDLALTWDQIEEMMGSGHFSIGSHTLTHPFLSQLDREAASREIAVSKSVLEDRLGVPMTTFCYPAGDFKAETVELVGEAGYKLAVVTPNRYISETPLTLLRIGVYRNMTPRLFKLKTSPAFGRLQRSRVGWGLMSQLRRGRRRNRR
jgi:peptidoglycan/xylan/chitin deacetylase (PgdA/CDA1 family)